IALSTRDPAPWRHREALARGAPRRPLDGRARPPTECGLDRVTYLIWWRPCPGGSGSLRPEPPPGRRSFQGASMHLPLTMPRRLAAVAVAAFAIAACQSTEPAAAPQRDVPPQVSASELAEHLSLIRHTRDAGEIVLESG